MYVLLQSQVHLIYPLETLDCNYVFVQNKIILCKSFWALSYINIKNLHLSLKPFHNFSCSYVCEIYPWFFSTCISSKYISVCVTFCGLSVGHILHSFIIVFCSLYFLQSGRCIRSPGDPEAYFAPSLTLRTLLKTFMIQVYVIFRIFQNINFLWISQCSCFVQCLDK